MAGEVAFTILIAGPVLIGLIISLIEMFFVMQDEGGMHPLGHGLHAVPTCLFFTMVSMNVPAVMSLSFMSWVPSWAANIGIPILIGLIATIKVKAAAAIVGGHGSVGEKFWHALAIGVLIALAPFVWPFIAPLLPEILNYSWP